MKRRLLKLASIAFVAAGIAGTALAESNLPATLDEGINGRTATQEQRACHEETEEQATALPIEAPWISLALANGERIGLSEEQVRQLEILRSEFAHTAERQQHTILTQERTLQQVLAADPVDLKRVGAQLDEIAAQRATLRLRRIEALLAGRVVLSAEQLTGLQALLARPAEAMHGPMMDGAPEQAAPAPTAGAM